MKPHPTHTNISVDSKGNIYSFGTKLKPRPQSLKNGRESLIVYINRVAYSAAKIILETYNPKPTNGKRYYSMSKDGSLNPEQLYWSTSNLNKKQKFKRDCHSSKLGTTQMYAIHFRNKNKGRSMAFLAKENNVSVMSIKRALNRLERKIG